MGRAWIVLGMIVIAGCASPTKNTPLTTQCTDPRPQVCTMEYAPVCAVREGGVRAEASSACNACADDKITGYVLGPCP